VRAEEHLLGARMLIRVSNHISKFPAHVVPILTSTVIECYRSGLKSEAFEYASLLMRPEHRQKLDEKFKRKIEQIVRRPEKSDEEEIKTPCIFCNADIPESLLDCPECKGRLPYCIFSGKHMVLNNWSQCPSCQFPALYSQAKLLADKVKSCPMCNQDVFSHQFGLINMTPDFLNSKKIIQEKTDTNVIGSNSPSIGGLTMS
jgi:WD repeat-containing protein 19